METRANRTGWLGLAMAVIFCIGNPAGTLAQTKMKTALGLTVQGQMGQTKEQQDKDDTECYRIAIKETKLDPVYVPGAIETKGNKVQSVSPSPNKAAPIPTESKIKRKSKRKRKSRGEVGGNTSKRDTKERLAELDSSQQDENLEEYKEAYRKCMLEKGYAVE